VGSFLSDCEFLILPFGGTPAREGPVEFILVLFSTPIVRFRIVGVSV